MGEGKLNDFQFLPEFRAFLKNIPGYLVPWNDASLFDTVSLERKEIVSAQIFLQSMAQMAGFSAGISRGKNNFKKVSGKLLIKPRFFLAM